MNNTYLLRATVAGVAVLGLVAAVGLGCKQNNKLIQGVGYEVDENLETIKVEMNFSKDVQSDIGGTFPIKDYGTIEIEPSTPDNPFSVGFRLNTAILDDQDYVNIEPTKYLPSGQPIPVTVNRALAQLTLKQDPYSKFDVYGYVDVARGEWMGVAITMKFLNEKNFPAGLSISQQWVKGKDGYYRVSAAVFGPKVDEAGKLVMPGGIALFANARGLINDARATNRYIGGEGASRGYLFDGPLAPHYRRHPRDAARVGDAFKGLLRMNDSRIRH